VDGFLDRSLQRHSALFRSAPRIEETNNARIDILRFEGPFAIDPEVVPLTNDWTVTGKGVVIGRFTFRDLEWTEHAEARIVAFGERVVAFLGTCC